MSTWPGDANQITRDYFDQLLVELRHFDAVLPDTSFELYGHKFATPIMTAALSHMDKIHPNGMAEIAKGAVLANAVMWAGMGSDEELDRITATGAKTIKIIKPDRDNDIILHNIRHAEKCGCIALGIDIDHAYNWKGEYDCVVGEHMSGKTLAEIAGFVKETKLPFIIKGVLSTTDAIKCVQAGVRGMVVSHHHGIQEFAAPPLMVLPEIAKVVDKDMHIAVDCSVESGMDAFKAIALGAHAVSVGRAIMGPLENGAEAVAEKLNEMTTRLAAAMTRTNCHTLKDIEPSILWNKSGKHFS